MVVMACREGRWVRSGGVLEFSCEAAWSEALHDVSVKDVKVTTVRLTRPKQSRDISRPSAAEGG